MRRLRPESVQIQLLADGVAVGEEITLSGEGNIWTHTWTGMPVYNQFGREVVYSIAEVDVTTRYTSGITVDASGAIVVTNELILEDNMATGLGSVRVRDQKIWVDSNDAYGLRPESITVNLMAGDKVIATQTVTGPDWKYSFASITIPEDAIIRDEGNGKATVNLTVAEEPVENYVLTSSVDPKITFNYPSANAWVKYTPCSSISISRSQSAKSIVVAKKGNRFNCWSTDALAPHEAEMVIAFAARTYGFSNDLSKWEFAYGLGASSEFGMTVTSDKITFNTTSTWSWFAMGTYSRSSASATTISRTNTVIPNSVTVSKEWVDADNYDGIRPESVTIRLLKNGEEIDFQTVTVADNWSYSFADLRPRDRHCLYLHR